jgi:hypothetical protein
MRASVRNGRMAMATFMGGGLLLLFTGNQDLFTAVAISGTASMFLAPVVVMCIWGGIAVPRWAYALSFALALTGALIYFLESSGYIAVFEWLIGPMHDYAKLLIINLAILAGGFGSFVVGAFLGRSQRQFAPAGRLRE